MEQSKLSHDVKIAQSAGPRYVKEWSHRAFMRKMIHRTHIKHVFSWNKLYFWMSDWTLRFLKRCSGRYSVCLSKLFGVETAFFTTVIKMFCESLKCFLLSLSQEFFIGLFSKIILHRMVAFYEDILSFHLRKSLNMFRYLIFKNDE